VDEGAQGDIRGRVLLVSFTLICERATPALVRSLDGDIG